MGSLWGCEPIRARSHWLCNLIGALPIDYELTVFARSSHDLSSPKHQVAYTNGMELYRPVVDLCHCELLKLPEESFFLKRNK